MLSPVSSIHSQHSTTLPRNKSTGQLRTVKVRPPYPALSYPSLSSLPLSNHWARLIHGTIRSVICLCEILLHYVGNERNFAVVSNSHQVSNTLHSQDCSCNLCDELVLKFFQIRRMSESTPSSCRVGQKFWFFFYNFTLTLEIVTARDKGINYQQLLLT